MLPLVILPRLHQHSRIGELKNIMECEELSMGQWSFGNPIPEDNSHVTGQKGTQRIVKLEVKKGNIRKMQLILKLQVIKNKVTCKVT